MQKTPQSSNFIEGSINLSTCILMPTYYFTEAIEREWSSSLTTCSNVSDLLNIIKLNQISSMFANVMIYVFYVSTVVHYIHYFY